MTMRERVDALYSRYLTIREQERDLVFKRGKFDEDIKSLIGEITEAKPDEAINLVEILHKFMGALA